MSLDRRIAWISVFLLPSTLLIASLACPALAQSLAPDHGRFRILLHGRTVGTENFVVTHQNDLWRVHSTIEVRAPGAPVERDTADLDLAADGSPLHYNWQGEAQQTRSIQVDFRKGAAQLALRRPGAVPALEAFSFPQDHLVVLDNNIYVHYEVLARLYNWATGGTQKFSVLIPQDVTPGTVTVESLGKRSIDGASLDLLTVKAPDLEVDLYLDATHRLIRMEVPASAAEVVRE